MYDNSFGIITPMSRIERGGKGSPIKFEITDLAILQKI